MYQQYEYNKTKIRDPIRITDLISIISVLHSSKERYFYPHASYKRVTIMVYFPMAGFDHSEMIDDVYPCMCVYTYTFAVGAIMFVTIGKSNKEE